MMMSDDWRARGASIMPRGQSGHARRVRVCGALELIIGLVGSKELVRPEPPSRQSSESRMLSLSTLVVSFSSAAGHITLCSVFLSIFVICDLVAHSLRVY